MGIDTEHQELSRKGESEFETDFHSAKRKIRPTFPLNNALKKQNHLKFILSTSLRGGHP